MFKALIFDMDGLMVDTEPLYWDVARLIAKNHGTTCSDETLKKMMGRSRIDSMRVFAQDCGITDTSPEDLLAEREEIMPLRFKQGVEPLPGLREILQLFHGKKKLAVATSSPKKFTDVILPALNVAHYFDVIQTGDEIVNGKPDPEIYLKAMSKLHVEPAESVVLEDSNAGAMSGHRAGAYVIAVPNPLMLKDDFSFANARVKDLNEAAAKIRSIEG